MRCVWGGVGGGRRIHPAEGAGGGRGVLWLCLSKRYLKVFMCFVFVDLKLKLKNDALILTVSHYTL